MMTHHHLCPAAFQQSRTRGIGDCPSQQLSNEKPGCLGYIYMIWDYTIQLRGYVGIINHYNKDHQYFNGK